MKAVCKCGSYAINHHCHGRDGSDGDLCDVCYWRKRAEQPVPMIRGDIRDGLVDDEPAQQEPVAWMDGYRNIYSLEEKAAGCPEATIALVPMANHKKTSGSPIKELNCICGAVWEGDELVHLPRPPAQRKPLTFSKLCDIEYEITHRDGDFSILNFARAIEAAHGIKENT